MQWVDENGKKLFRKGSEWLSSAFVIREPLKKESIVYLCEGLNTGYAVLMGAKKDAGIYCVGGITNYRYVMTELQKKEYKNIVLCAEKEGYEKYKELKAWANCSLIGSKKYEDLDSFYRKTNLSLLKKALLSFQENNYIPLGLDEKNQIVIYLKTVGNIHRYKKNDADILFTDAYNIEQPAEKEVIMTFFWRTRKQCRLLGTVDKVLVFKEGIFPYKGDYYYYDTQRVYLINKKKIVKIDPVNLISNSLVLKKETNERFPDLEKVNALNRDQIRELFSYLRLFKFKEIEYKLLAGWVIQSVICGGLSHRTPIWITAKESTGKTQMTKRLLLNFFLFYDSKTGRSTTPKWLTRRYSGRAMPLHRDEYEPSERHRRDTDEEMSYVRASATERFPSRGISDGLQDSTIDFKYCFSALFTSIKEPDELTKADITRFIFFRPKPYHAKNYELRIKEFEDKMTKEYKSAFLKTCMLAMHNIQKSFDSKMNNPKYREILTHRKASFFMLASCYNAVAGTEEDKIEPDDIKRYMDMRIEKRHSKIMKKCLTYTLNKHNYNLTENRMLIELLRKKEGRKILRDKGIFIRKKKELLVDIKKGVLFFQRLCKENGSPIDSENLDHKMKNDGEYFIKTVTVGVLKDQSVPRGTYWVFDWKNLKGDLYG